MIWNGYIGACTSEVRTGLDDDPSSFHAFWTGKGCDESSVSSLSPRDETLDSSHSVRLV